MTGRKAARTTMIWQKKSCACGKLQEQTVMDDAAKAAHRERIQELLHFINSQPRTITEFDEALVKKLLESVKVCEFFLEFRFKSGVTIIIEK